MMMVGGTSSASGVNLVLCRIAAAMRASSYRAIKPLSLPGWAPLAQLPTIITMSTTDYNYSAGPGWKTIGTEVLESNILKPLSAMRLDVLQQVLVPWMCTTQGMKGKMKALALRSNRQNKAKEVTEKRNTKLQKREQARNAALSSDKVARAGGASKCIGQ
eukprot:Filipodium_phascolosomae@DN5247_c0_g1_i1.p1